MPYVFALHYFRRPATKSKPKIFVKLSFWAFNYLLDLLLIVLFLVVSSISRTGVLKQKSRVFRPLLSLLLESETKLKIVLRTCNFLHFRYLLRIFPEN